MDIFIYFLHIFTQNLSILVEMTFHYIHNILFYRRVFYSFFIYIVYTALISLNIYIIRQQIMLSIKILSIFLSFRTH